MPARKQTSAELSTLAAELLARCPKSGNVAVKRYLRSGFHETKLCSARQFRSLMASLVSQDETPAQKPKKRATRKARKS